MDEATKKGYGMLMLQQGLPKSGFYASAIARLKRDLADRQVAPVKPHLPYGVLGKAPPKAAPDDSFARTVNSVTARLDKLHAALEDVRADQRSAATGSAALAPDGREVGTSKLYERLIGILDGPDGLEGRLKSVRDGVEAAHADSREAGAKLEESVEKLRRAVAPKLDAIEERVALIDETLQMRDGNASSEKLEALGVAVASLRGAVGDGDRRSAEALGIVSEAAARLETSVGALGTDRKSVV